ncbi:MAG: ClpXP protease specificity-enhancing factor [Halieaceae bacterium]
MTPSRPYIVRAIYEWIVDNDCTPHLLVDATCHGVIVPETFVKDGQIVLNISSAAVVGLQIDNERVSFNGRFGGQPRDVEVPIAAVLGIYARENGQGMVFENGSSPEPDPPDADPPKDSKAKRPALKIVK